MTRNQKEMLMVFGQATFIVIGLYVAFGMWGITGILGLVVIAFVGLLGWGWVNFQ